MVLVTLTEVSCMKLTRALKYWWVKTVMEKIQSHRVVQVVAFESDSLLALNFRD